MKTTPIWGAATALALTLSSCSAAVDTTTVTVITHDAWAMSTDAITAFEEESGYTLEFLAPGDAGTLVSQLILTADNPLGDVVYGVDNTFASRATNAGIFEPYESETEGTFADVGGFPGLTAIDYSYVCINADTGYFTSHDVPLPRSLEDLTKPEYAGLLSVTNPATSSPGLAFLLATVASQGDEWPAYWEALVANEVRVTSSWSETYFTDFSAPNYGGDYPLVLSYASSPPFEVIDGEATTVALLDTCFTQVEYAGVLAGTDNPDGAQAVIDWMRSQEFQQELPTQMYVYPISRDVDLPEEWASHAPAPTAPFTLDPQVIDENRADLIARWNSIVLD